MSYEKGNSTDLILNSKHHKLIGDRMSFNTCWMLHRTLNYPEQHYIWVRSIDSFDIHNDDVFECVFFSISAAYYLDIFMDNHTIRFWRLYLVALTSLRIAAKIEERDFTLARVERLNASECLLENIFFSR